MPRSTTQPSSIETHSLDEETPERVVIPYTDLAADVRQRLIESFVLREGTEYGSVDMSLAAKVGQVMRQLERGEAQIVFDPASESVDIVRVDKRAGSPKR